MLELLLLSALLAAGPAQAADQAEEVAIVALKTGQAFKVRSYKLEGRMLRIVGLEGEPLVMRAEQIDIARSKELTETYHEQQRAEVEARLAAEQAARERAAERARKNAEHRALVATAPGGLNTARGSLSQPGSSAGTESGSEQRTAGGQPEAQPADKQSVEQWSALFNDLRSRYRAAREQVAMLEQAIKSEQNPMSAKRMARGSRGKDFDTAEEGASGRSPGTQLIEELEQKREELREIQIDWDQQVSRARAEGVPPSLYVKGLGG